MFRFQGNCLTSERMNEEQDEYGESIALITKVGQQEKEGLVISVASILNSAPQMKEYDYSNAVAQLNTLAERGAANAATALAMEPAHAQALKETGQAGGAAAGAVGSATASIEKEFESVASNIGKELKSATSDLEKELALLKPKKLTKVKPAQQGKTKPAESETTAEEETASGIGKAQETAAESHVPTVTKVAETKTVEQKPIVGQEKAVQEPAPPQKITSPHAKRVCQKTRIVLS